MRQDVQKGEMGKRGRGQRHYWEGGRGGGRGNRAHVPQAAGQPGDKATDRGPGKARRDETLAHRLC